MILPGYQHVLRVCFCTSVFSFKKFGSCNLRCNMSLPTRMTSCQVVRTVLGLALPVSGSRKGPGQHWGVVKLLQFLASWFHLPLHHPFHRPHSCQSKHVQIQFLGETGQMVKRCETVKCRNFLVGSFTMQVCQEADAETVRVVSSCGCLEGRSSEVCCQGGRVKDGKKVMCQSLMSYKGQAKVIMNPSKRMHLSFDTSAPHVIWYRKTCCDGSWHSGPRSWHSMKPCFTRYTDLSEYLIDNGSVIFWISSQYPNGTSF